MTLAELSDYGITAVILGLVADAIRRYVFERRRLKAANTLVESDAAVAAQTADLRVDAALLANAEAQLAFTTKAFEAERSSWQMRIEAQRNEIAGLREAIETKEREHAKKIDRLNGELRSLADTVERLERERESR